MRLRRLLVAAAVALGFARRGLGPDLLVTGRRRPASACCATSREGWSPGPGRRRGTPAVAAPFLGLVAHRLAFGSSNTLLMLMLFRSVFAGTGVGGLAGGGHGRRAHRGRARHGRAADAWLVGRLGIATTVRVALGGAAVAQLAVASALVLPVVLVTAFALGVCGQIVKLCADAGVQSGAEDVVRGRVFALFDAVFNVCYVLAVTAAALAAPATGTRAPCSPRPA